MKNAVILFAVLLAASCKPAANETGSEAQPEDRAIGFNTMLPDLKFHLGTEEAIQVVKDLDKLWAARNYEAMKSFFVDTVSCEFADGRVAHSPQEFVDILQADDEGSEDSWTFDYAFSVDLDPTRGGEHVQAGFTGTSTKDGETIRKYYHESYYIVGGKIVSWRQYTCDIPKEE